MNQIATRFISSPGCYAICQQPDGSFELIKADGKSDHELRILVEEDGSVRTEYPGSCKYRNRSFSSAALVRSGDVRFREVLISVHLGLFEAPLRLEMPPTFDY